VEHLESGPEAVERRRARMDRATFGSRRQWRPAIDRVAHDVEKAPEHDVAHRHPDGRMCCVSLGSAADSASVLQCNRANGEGIEVLLNLGEQPPLFTPLYLDAFVDRRQQSGGETHVDNRTVNGNKPPAGSLVTGFWYSCHEPPFVRSPRGTLYDRVTMYFAGNS
jgi:hypothetical protein